MRGQPVAGMWRTRPWGHVLVASVVAAACLAAAAQHQEQAVTPKNDASKELEELYQAAMVIRQKRNPSWREQARTVEELLVVAAGVRASRHHDHASQQAPKPRGTPVPGFPGLELSVHAHRGALRELALVSMDGWGCEMDARFALALFQLAASLGDPDAHAQLGIRAALGLHHLDSWDAGGIVRFGEPDEDTALLHLYMGAAGGSALAQVVLGHMHAHGLGVPKSCWTAASYYLPVAEQVADMAGDASGPGLPHIERIRLSVHYLHGSKADRQKEVVQYYQDSADKGNVDAQTAVGQVLNFGTHGVERDHEAAASYLQRAADAGDGQAMAHLGHMLANGLGGGSADYSGAFRRFTTAAAQGVPSAQYGLGYMHLVGLGADQDFAKAYALLSEAAGQGHADAHFLLGVMYMKGLGVKRRNTARAFTSFSLAAHAGNVQAMYNAALLHLSGRGTTKSCRPAMSLLKQASERGPTAGVLQLGHEAFFRGQYRRALWQYLQAAAAGMEIGQSNAAWLLDQGYVRASGRVANVTFALYQRSAAQGNVASLLALGDAYFYGKGVDQNWARASAIYYEAYQERSAEAMFNLGFMHEFGAGVPKDLSLAARFYGMAAHTSTDALLAVWCARVWLAAHRAWDAVRPYLPAAYDVVWNRMWALIPPHTSVLGSWTAVVASLLPSQAVIQMELGAWAWLDTLGVTGLLNAVSDAKEMGETLVLMGLMTLLYVVLRVRQRRVVRQAGAAGGGAGQRGEARGDAAEVILAGGGGRLTEEELAQIAAQFEVVEARLLREAAARAAGVPLNGQGGAANGAQAGGQQGAGQEGREGSQQVDGAGSAAERPAPANGSEGRGMGEAGASAEDYQGTHGRGIGNGEADARATPVEPPLP